MIEKRNVATDSRSTVDAADDEGALRKEASMFGTDEGRQSSRPFDKEASARDEESDRE